MPEIQTAEIVPAKVPLNIGWLSENNLLNKAGTVLGFETFGIPGAYKSNIQMQPTSKGVWVSYTDANKPTFLFWEDSLLFTVAQLLALDFDPGEFKYCPCCKLLQVDCDREREQIVAHNDQSWAEADEIDYRKEHGMPERQGA